MIMTNETPRKNGKVGTVQTKQSQRELQGGKILVTDQGAAQRSQSKKA